jgi:hypothetical protein
VESTTIRITAATKRLLDSLFAEGRKHDGDLTQQELVDRALAIAARHKAELFDDRPVASAKEFNAWLDGIAGDYGDLSSNIDDVVYGGS